MQPILRQHIFVDESNGDASGDRRPFASCHASSLIQLPGGAFLAVWFGGTAEGRDDVAIWGAHRDPGGWSAPRLLAKVDDRPHWNPVLFAAADGRLHLFFKVGRTIPAWETWTMVSADGGRRWTTPRPLVSGDRGGRGPVKNKPIRLADGTWLAGASIETSTHWDVFVDRSQDEGRSWQASPLVPLDHAQCDGRGVIQPTLWESEPGHVHMLVRSTCGRIWRSDSADGGHTWCQLYPLDLPNNNSGLDLVRLDDGALVLVCNPVATRARTPLSLLRSSDNGHTWPARLDLETAPGEYSYPAIVATGPQAVAVTYTWRRTRIAFCTVGCG